jgi:hypothetical protein
MNKTSIKTNALLHDWSALLDELKQKESISSDAKIAAELGVSRGYICSVRKGRNGLSFKLAQIVFSRLGKTFETGHFESLFIPVRVQARNSNLVLARNYVMQRANGYCQLCGCEAPFKDSQGRPYLKIHHVRPIREGGTDSPDNLVALCPNCHSRINVRQDATDQRKLKKIVMQYKSKVRIV